MRTILSVVSFLFVAAAPAGGMTSDIKGYADWGVTAALVWYLWYNTSVATPKKDTQHRSDMDARDSLARAEAEERERRHKADADEREKRNVRDALAREERFEHQLSIAQQAFISALQDLSSKNQKERKAVRAVMRDLTEGEKMHAEALLRLAGLIEVNERDAKNQREDDDEARNKH